MRARGTTNAWCAARDLARAQGGAALAAWNAAHPGGAPNEAEALAAVRSQVTAAKMRARPKRGKGKGERADKGKRKGGKAAGGAGAGGSPGVGGVAPSRGSPGVAPHADTPFSTPASPNLISWSTDPAILLSTRQWVTSNATAKERCDLRALFASDPAAWLALTGWTYRVKETGADGRERPAVVRDVPFIPWDIQVSAIRKLAASVQDGRDVVIRKSRDMGASWLVVSLATWGWLFHNWQSLLVSRV